MAHKYSARDVNPVSKKTKPVPIAKAPKPHKKGSHNKGSNKSMY